MFLHILRVPGNLWRPKDLQGRAATTAIVLFFSLEDVHTPGMKKKKRSTPHVKPKERRKAMVYRSD